MKKEILAYVEHQEKEDKKATVINIAVGVRSTQSSCWGEFNFVTLALIWNCILGSNIKKEKVRYIVDADIKDFFNHINL